MTRPDPTSSRLRTPGLRTDGGLLLGRRAGLLRNIASALGQALLFLVACTSALAVLLIFIFIIRDALPFLTNFDHLKEFFTSTRWFPSNADHPEFGALAMFFGSAMVTVGAVVVAVPLGVLAAVCLSDVLPFRVRQYVKPIVEVLAAIPSVAYGFFALVVFSPLLQQHGGGLLSAASWIVLGPLGALVVIVAADLLADRLAGKGAGKGAGVVRVVLIALLGAAAAFGLWKLSSALLGVQISSGTNALNVSIILGIMALPTIVSVSEDALYAAGRELREGSYALGATRAETILRVVIPAARSGIFAAVILGVMRAVGETMVVWMASGNAAHIPEPFYNFLEPIRTLTATIAGDMGEADQTTGSARYHVLFAMAFCLLAFSFLANLASEWFVRRGVAGRRAAKEAFWARLARRLPAPLRRFMPSAAKDRNTE